MPKTGDSDVTMRVRIGDAEVEVTGPAAFVEQKVEEFLEKQASLQGSKSVGGQAVAETLPSEKAAGPQAKPMSAAQFFKKSGARSDVDRILVAGYYLERTRGQEVFTSTEAAELVRGAKINPATNPSDAISKNIRKGLIMAAGDRGKKRVYVLTSDGEDAVNEMVSAE